jgi:hypothetical protein
MTSRNVQYNVHPLHTLKDTLPRRGSIWRFSGSGELYEYLLPEGSRMVHGNIYVRENGKLVCLGTVGEAVAKGLLLGGE